MMRVLACCPGLAVRSTPCFPEPGNQGKKRPWHGGRFCGRRRMTVGNKGIFWFELAGSVFIILAGSALHFAFEWSGNWLPLAVFAAVNESIWEHLKIAFWPGIAWGILTILLLQQSWRRVIAVKGIGLLLTAVLIVVIFEAYTHILGTNLLAFDIATFAFAVIAGQLLSARLLASPSLPRPLVQTGLALAAMQMALYATLSYFPPPLWLFVDGSTGQAGLH